MRRLYSLLVGINDYPRKPLKGCVNDALAWQSYLEEWAGKSGRLSIESLLDQHATRRRIIEGFRLHLGQASRGDTALFCFSGHGSQERAPLPYAAEEPGGLSETVLAYDSRTEGGLDIADKELAVLIAEVARGGAHVVVILDSCHSGTATRVPEQEGRVRRMAASRWQRQSGSYWFQTEEVQVPAELDSAGGWRVLPAGCHVLLAACEDYQVARECTTADGTKRGLFSYYLLETLERLGPEVSYRELFKWVRTRVGNRCSDQRPQAEGQLDRTVLEGAITARAARLYARLQKDGRWWLDAGAVHAIRPGVEVAVMPPGVSDGQDLSRRLATARVEAVEAGSSRLHVSGGELPKDVTAYPAVITHLRLPPVKVAVDGSSTDAERVRRILEHSAYLMLASDLDGADVIVLEDGETWRLRRPGAAGDLVAPLAVAATGAREMADGLEQIARWQTIAELSSPGSPLSDALEMTIWEWRPPPSGGQEPELRPLSADGEILLPYRVAPGEGYRPGRISVQLRSRTERPVYYALLALSETFAVRLIQGAMGRLGAGEQVWIRRSSGIPGTVPDVYHQQGVTERRDLLVLLTSAVEVDLSLLEQKGLFETPGQGVARGSRKPEALSLETLLRPTARREMDEASLVAREWAAKRQVVVSVRPMSWRLLPDGVESVELVQGVRLWWPKGLSGEVRLHGTLSARGFPGLAELPLEKRASLRRVTLAGALGSDAGLSVLELRLDDWGVVSEAHPLMLETSVALEGDEVLGAIVWDGRESYLMPLPDERAPRGSLRIRSLRGPAAGHDTCWLELCAIRPSS